MLVAGIAVAAGWAASGLEVRSDITGFLPSGEDRQLARLSRRIAHSELNRTTTLTVRAPDADAAARATGRMAEALRRHPTVDWVRAGPDGALRRTVYELYFPHRLGFIDDEPERIDDLLSARGIDGRIAALKRRLAGPMGPFVQRIAREDPWLLFVRHFERVRASLQGDVHVHRGKFVTGPERRVGVLWAATRESAFETPAQRRFQHAVRDAFARAREREPGELELEQASIGRIAIRSEEIIRQDIARVSIAGTVGVVLLVLLLFRSVRALALGVLPIAAGIGAAVAVSRLAFGSLHGLTLAFGMTLIGVAIDYIAHFLSHQHLAPHPAGPKGTMRRIWPGLALGAATTVVGLVGLAWTSFPGVREIAVFTTVGVVTSLAVTRFVLPPFSVPRPASTASLERLARASERGLGWLAAHRRWVGILPAGAAVVCALGWPRLEWQDDLRKLSSPDPQLLAEEERVRARVSRMDTGRVALATGGDMQRALERNARVHEVLEDAASDGLIAGHRSLHPLLWPVSLQRGNRDAIPSDAWQRTASALRAHSFVVPQFEPFEKALARPFEPLTFEALRGTPMESLAAPFRVKMDDQVALLSFVRDVEDPRALARRVESLEGVRWLDQGRIMARAYRNLRRRTLELVAFGLVAVLALLMARYRRFGPALAAFLPAVVAALTSVGVLGLLGIEANLLHVITLLLVLSMGVDYGVFMVESGRHAQGRAATLVALLVACGSTALSFGVLGLSRNPAMRAMGLTAAIGVALALVLAPLAWVLLSSEPRSPRPRSRR